MNVSLTNELETLVKDKVSSGRYSSASEVIRAGLRLLDEHEQKLEALRADVREGLDSLDNGEGKKLDMAAIKKKARKRHAEKTSAKH